MTGKAIVLVRSGLLVLLVAAVHRLFRLRGVGAQVQCHMVHAELLQRFQMRAKIVWIKGGVLSAVKRNSPHSDFGFPRPRNSIRRPVCRSTSSIKRRLPRNTSVTLDDDFDALVSEKIAEGRFQSVSETVSAGLRRLEEDELKLEALRAKLGAGEASPLFEYFSMRELCAEMRAKYGN